MKNIYDNIPEELPEELIEKIYSSNNIRIERIISKGQNSPEDFWYDQNKNEWVLLLKGNAKLKFKNEIVEMKEGDYINIPAHKKHRVEWTDPENETIWLCVFY